MTTTTNTNSNTPQSNYQSNQNYDADVATLFKHFVTGGSTPNDNEPGENIGIDDIRAQISPSVTSTGTTTANLITSLNINPNTNAPAPTPNTTTPVLLVQESRCHAFYRILGLPVVSANASNFYNPGFDITKRYYQQLGLTQSIPLSEKITIASAVGKPFEAISAARETWAATTSQIFSSPTSVEAGVLALTSGTYGTGGTINKRLFNVLQKVTGPFDFNSAHQTYAIASLTSLVGDSEQLLATFQDANANTILSAYVSGTGASAVFSAKSPSTTFFTHQHIIAPFMVDPRIDFSVWSNESKTFNGMSKRIAVPFVPDASFLQVSSTANAERPVIEQIIRKRMYQANQATEAGANLANAQAFIQNDPTIGAIPFIGSAPLSNIFSSAVFGLSQQNSFADTLSYLQSLIKKLVVSLQKVHLAQGIYYWLPMPNTTGPEGGSNIRDVPLNQNFSNNLVTDEDFNIIYNQTQVLFSNITVAATQANAIPDRGGYAFGGNFSFNKDTTDAQGDVSSNTQNNLAAKRNKILNDASDALQIIEMIMGEFSGLGLCDILAVIGALYTMPMTNLVGFLDDDAYLRASVLLGAGLPARTGISDSMTALMQGVSGFYQIMDQVFVDTVGNGSLNLTS
jgi:hypothetical protein